MVGATASDAEVAMKLFFGGTLVAKKVKDFSKFCGVDSGVLIAVEEIEDGTKIGDGCGKDVGGTEGRHFEGMGLATRRWHCSFLSVS